MLIFTSHIWTIVLSPEGHALGGMFLKPFKKRVLSGLKNTRLRLVFLNPIKHSCSFFKHYIKKIGF